MWICSKCGEDSEDGFDLCWNCGTGRDGQAAPDDFASVADSDLRSDVEEGATSRGGISSQEDLDAAFFASFDGPVLVHRYERPFGPSQLRVYEGCVVWLRDMDGCLQFDVLPYSSVLALEYLELKKHRAVECYLRLRTVYGECQVLGTQDELNAIISAVAARIARLCTT